MFCRLLIEEYLLKTGVLRCLLAQCQMSYPVIRTRLVVRRVVHTVTLLVKQVDWQGCSSFWVAHQPMKPSHLSPAGMAAITLTCRLHLHATNGFINTADIQTYQL
jgi:hypothetical protein